MPTNAPPPSVELQLQALADSLTTSADARTELVYSIARSLYTALPANDRRWRGAHWLLAFGQRLDWVDDDGAPRHADFYDAANADTRALHAAVVDYVARLEETIAGGDAPDAGGLVAAADRIAAATRALR